MCGRLHKWFQNYVRYCWQLHVAGKCSRIYPISSGIAQGSILGPLLFLVYVNDLEDCLPEVVKLVVYADDTCTTMGTVSMQRRTFLTPVATVDALVS